MKATFDRKSRASVLLCLAGLLLFVAPKARADEPTNYPSDDNPNASDPPARVARISYLDGNVSFQPSGTEDWAAAAKNDGAFVFESGRKYFASANRRGCDQLPRTRNARRRFV